MHVGHELPLLQVTMADFSQKQRKQDGGEGLGSVVDFLLANARLVLGVGGAAVLGIATLAVKRVRPGCQGLPETSTGRGQARRARGWWDFLRSDWNTGPLLLTLASWFASPCQLCHGPRYSDLCHFACSSLTGPLALGMRMTPRGTAGRN